MRPQTANSSQPISQRCLRSQLHKLIQNCESTKSEIIDKNYKVTLKSSIAQLKDACEEKFKSINVD